LDLLGVDDLRGQVIVHLRVRQIALLLAASDQQLDLGLMVLGHHGYAALDSQGSPLYGTLLRSMNRPFVGTTGSVGPEARGVAASGLRRGRLGRGCWTWCGRRWLET